MKSHTIRIDLGCGNDKTKGCLGLDRTILPGVDVVGLVDSTPFKSSVADEIYASHLLEHSPSLVTTVEEIWRICKPGAIVHVWSPHVSCGFYAWSDPTHVRALTTSTFDYWEPQSAMSYYSSARFEVILRELHYGLRTTSPSPIVRLLKSTIAKFVEPLANFNRTSQIFCERVWGPWIGFEEVYFELKCVKP